MNVGLLCVPMAEGGCSIQIGFLLTSQRLSLQESLDSYGKTIYNGLRFWTSCLLSFGRLGLCAFLLNFGGMCNYFDYKNKQSKVVSKRPAAFM